MNTWTTSAGASRWLKHAAEKIADTIKDTAHHAGEEMKEEGQKVKDAAK
jgi:predicted small secreted protein